MVNKQNLKVPTSEEARKNGHKGGVASAQSRKRKKELRECLEILLETNLKDKNGKKMTGAEAMAVRAFQDALKGNYKAWELVRDTAGQKPVERVRVSEIDPDIAAEIERMLDSD